MLFADRSKLKGTRGSISTFVILKENVLQSPLSGFPSGLICQNFVSESRIVKVSIWHICPWWELSACHEGKARAGGG